MQMQCCANIGQYWTTATLGPESCPDIGPIFVILANLRPICQHCMHQYFANIVCYIVRYWPISIILSRKHSAVICNKVMIKLPHHIWNSSLNCIVKYHVSLWIISQGSVATHLSCGGISNDYIIANLLLVIFLNRATIDAVMPKT